MANQEKVWIAEQKEQAEKAKTAELAKQIRLEREEEELQKIAGNSDQRLDRGIAWLYDGHRKDSETARADAEKEREEYLLGKAYAPAQHTVGDLDGAGEEAQGVNAVVASVDHSAPANELVVNRNEAFRVRHEDPMYDIVRQKVRQEKAQDHRKELYLKAGYAVKQKDSDGEERKAVSKKRHKKDKKHKGEKKKRKKRRRYSSSSSDEDDRKQSPDSYRERSERKRHRRRKSYSRSSSVESYSRRSSSRRRYRSRSRSRSPRYHRRRPSRSISPIHSHERDHRASRDRRSRGDVSRRPRSRDGDDARRRYSSREDNPSRHSEERDEFGRVRVRHPPAERTKKKDDKYGLQGSSKNAPTAASDLGPDRDLLERKRKEREAEQQRRVEAKQRHHASAQDRRAALDAMARDAEIHATTRDRSKGDYSETATTGKTDASFLQTATAQAHGLGGAQQSLADRLQQNRHRNQRDTDGFL